MFSVSGLVLQRQDFDWDSRTQGVVLSSFFYGYMCTQVLGGWLGARLGGSRVYGAGVAVTALLTLITPPAVNYSVYLLLAIRIIEGLFEVGIYTILMLISVCLIDQLKVNGLSPEVSFRYTCQKESDESLISCIVYNKQDLH